MLTALNKFLGWMKDKKISLVVWIILLIIVLKVWLILPREFWQYIFFMRVPIIASLSLITLPIVATTLLRSMLKNVYVLRGKWQLTFVIIGANIAGIATILIANTILINAPDRFNLTHKFVIEDWIQYVLAIVLALPTCITATRLSIEERELTGKEGLESVLLGGGISAIVLYLVSITREWLRSQVSLLPIVIKVIEVVSKHRTEGYLIKTPEGIELARGHLPTIAFVFVELLVYLVIFSSLRRPKFPNLIKLKRLQKEENLPLYYMYY